MASKPLQPPPVPAEPINANSVPWQNFFKSAWNIIGGLITEQQTIANGTSNLGENGHFVTLNANGDLQDAGVDPDLTSLQHNHSNIATGGPITPATSSNFLSGDVTLTSANTWYDGPSLTFSANTTWVVGGQLTCEETSASGGEFGIVLWDGTTVYASGEFIVSAAMPSVTIPITPVPITFSANTTLKLSAQNGVGGGYIRANTTATTNTANASYIVAYQV